MVCKKSGMGERTITPSKLSEILSYDSESGDLMWTELLPQRSKFGKQAFLNVRDGYRCGVVQGFSLRAHRVAWALFYGEWPDGEVDHINGDRQDNRISNLRVVSQHENARNRKLQSNNTSGVNGVIRHRGKWIVKFTKLGKTKQFGRFDSFDDAVACADMAKAELGFHENHGARI